MKSLESLAFNEELKFYRQCYSIQRSYIESVMNLFRVKFEQFITEIRDSFSAPLKALIEKFWLMKNESTEENLKDFLGFFKLHAKKFDSILENMEKLPENDLIEQTFHTLVNQLDDQIIGLNKTFSNNLDKINLNKIDLNELSAQSDSLLSEILNASSVTSSTAFNNDFI